MTNETLLQTLSDTYNRATRRLIVLDYDGTLTSFKPTPPEAKPTDSLMRLLGDLAADTRNHVVILSGRDRNTLTDWFGHLPIALGAEHGFFVRPLGRHWHATKHAHLEWKPAVREAMEAADLEGAFVEDKAVAIAWQYRRADQRHARPVAHQLEQRLQDLADDQDLKVMHGHRVIEVLPPGADKGTAAKYWITQGPYDFILAAGDDRTDRDLFRALPDEPYAFSIDIGKRGIADIELPTPASFREVLKRLITHSI